LITRHLWKCKDCDIQISFTMNDEDLKDNKKLARYETFLTKHVLETEHEVTHKQKDGEWNYKFV